MLLSTSRGVPPPSGTGLGAESSTKSDEVCRTVPTAAIPAAATSLAPAVNGAAITATAPTTLSTALTPDPPPPSALFMAASPWPAISAMLSRVRFQISRSPATVDHTMQATASWLWVTSGSRLP